MAPFSHLSEVITDAIALAIVIFAISISMGKLLAKKHDYEVDANQVTFLKKDHFVESDLCYAELCPLTQPKPS